jgi:hypothetical protein
MTVEMSPPTLEAAQCDALHIGSLRDEPQQIGSLHDEPQQIGSLRDEPHCGVARKTHVGSSESAPTTTEHAQTTAIRPAQSTTSEPFESTTTKSAQSTTTEHAQTTAIRPAQSTTSESVESTTTKSAQSTTSKPAQSTTTKRAKSIIPPALRRKVNHRDHGRCRVPWCRSSRNCDQHHMRPVALGGEHSAENLITLCESHHLAHHAGALIIEGSATTAVFTRRAHHSFAIAERAVETARALRDLGFDKHEVKAAMDKTRTHVGTTELTLEQWIKIALSYCPKPRS